MIVDTLKNRYPLPTLLKKLSFPKSSYYHHETAFRKEDKYCDIRKKVMVLFHENKKRYGYRRIYRLLKREGITISEKEIRHIMREESLEVTQTKRRNIVPIKKRFPKQCRMCCREISMQKSQTKKWLTDISEFAIPARKVYLSPIVDCFNGMVTCRTIRTTPDSTSVNTMLAMLYYGFKKASTL